MEDSGLIPTQRFSGHVEDYIKYRPSYPHELIDLFCKRLYLRREQSVVDVGSGTGILSRPFLDRGHTVIGVEPNVEMANAAKVLLAGYSKFHSVRATAEATGLKERTADIIVAGQAFHWFDVGATRNEFSRIVKPGGTVVLIWNIRLLNRTPFMRAYEAFLHCWGTDYEEVSVHYANPDSLEKFFGPAGYECNSSANHQTFDLRGLQGRLLSCSYIPGFSHPDFEPMMGALSELFETHQQDASIRFEYETRLFFGPVILG